MRLLSSSSEGAQAAAASALCSLANDDALADTIAAAGAIPALVRLLGSGSERVQKEAAGALWTLALGSPATPHEVPATGALAAAAG